MQRALDAMLGPTLAAPDAPPRPESPAGEALCLPNPERLPHELAVAGPATDLRAFREAVAGPGRIPWAIDYDAQRDAWTTRLLALAARRPNLSSSEARGIALALRERVEALDLATIDEAGQPLCPLDLHALAPLPARLLALGPEAPDVVPWLWANWGTTWMLRHVAEIDIGRAALGLPEGHAAVRYAFWAADWTPWRALASVRRRWPSLALHLRLPPISA